MPSLDIHIYRWEREGAEGWSYEDVLPYFKKAQVSLTIVSRDHFHILSVFCIYNLQSRPTARAVTTTAAAAGRCT